MFQGLRVPPLLQPDHPDVVLRLGQLGIQPQRLPVGALGQLEQLHPGRHQAEHQMRLRFLRRQLDPPPGGVDRLLAVA
jgi:hypothetical protein